MTFPGDYTLRCRACEAQLGRPTVVSATTYGLVENKHGAVVRQCKECHQLWLSFVMNLPNTGMKVMQKMIDKLL